MYKYMDMHLCIHSTQGLNVNKKHTQSHTRKQYRYAHFHIYIYDFEIHRIYIENSLFNRIISCDLNPQTFWRCRNFGLPYADTRWKLKIIMWKTIPITCQAIGVALWMNPIARKGEHTARTASTIARCKEYTIFLEPPTNKKKTFLYTTTLRTPHKQTDWFDYRRSLLRRRSLRRLRLTEPVKSVIEQYTNPFDLTL